tara:strand:+ start:81 stop:674 length:594 start_codon:yes stop_codon:yes gene_type:complete
VKNIKPFGPTIGITKIKKSLIKKLNDEFDLKSTTKKKDYSSKLASQINDEVLFSNNFVKKHIHRDITSLIKKFLIKENIKKIKDIKILNFWIVRQFKGEYNPIHYHQGDISGVGYIKIPKFIFSNKKVKFKKDLTNGTIDFINGQKAFLSNCIHNIKPEVGKLIIFPNYLMHTVYPFNVEGERRSFSFNAKISFTKE